MRGNLLTVLVIIFFASVPSFVVHALFMDMYGKVFQVELLDDCTIYAYDRVLDPKGPKKWCLTNLASIDVDVKIINWTNSNISYGAIFCFYVDKDNIVNVINVYTGIYDIKQVKLISQDYYGALGRLYYNVTSTPHVKHVTTDPGRHLIQTWTPKSNNYGIIYKSCKGSLNFQRYVFFDEIEDTAKVSDMKKSNQEKCDPYLYTKWINLKNISVYINPNAPVELICSVDNLTFVLRPIQQSIQTTVLGYDMFVNLSQSFPPTFAKKTSDNSTRSFAGVIIQDGKFLSSSGETWERPPLDHLYSEVPFFFVSANATTYYPLFLYYKYDGDIRDFTVRFIYKEKLHTIFNPVKYMDTCKFKDLRSTVAAAPKVLQHDNESISMEVYFLMNNAAFQFCVFGIQYTYASKEYVVHPKTKADINAYVHVETRSKTAVNCNYGNRTVRWLLAYTKGKEAELISLDNDVSSPIFPCSHCGPNTLMYCDMRPKTAKMYDSAVYVITGKDILFVGVTRSGYVKRIEYFSQTMDSEQYFAQEISITLDLDEIFHSLQSAEKPSGVDTVSGDGNEGEGNEGDSNASGTCYLRMPLLFVILMCRFLMELT